MSHDDQCTLALFGARLALYLGEMGNLALRLARAVPPELAREALEEMRRINRNVEKSLAEFEATRAVIQ